MARFCELLTMNIISPGDKDWRSCGRHWIPHGPSSLYEESKDLWRSVEAQIEHNRDASFGLDCSSLVYQVVWQMPICRASGKMRGSIQASRCLTWSLSEQSVDGRRDGN